MTFVPRLTRPEAGNKYYITQSNGGYSRAIKGKPTDKYCDVLSNCVGYSYGRFNEVGGYGYCKYLVPVNAENFIKYKGSCEVGNTPKLGAVMVWEGAGDLAGHVANVEKINADGSIVTSESGYNCSTPFWTKTRTNSNGNWGSNTSKYKFLGFIYNPAVKDEETPKVEEKPTTSGDIQPGDTVIVNGVGTASSYGTGATTRRFTDTKMKVIGIANGRQNAYALNQYNRGDVGNWSHVTGWFNINDIRK